MPVSYALAEGEIFISDHLNFWIINLIEFQGLPGMLFIITKEKDKFKTRSASFFPLYYCLVCISWRKATELVLWDNLDLNDLSNRFSQALLIHIVLKHGYFTRMTSSPPPSYLVNQASFPVLTLGKMLLWWLNIREMRRPVRPQRPPQQPDNASRSHS